ncbi:hypothetical protein CDL12_18813 [Handroanthus impetiginosus]|uniref:Uncharacterized protein n=1 Tax=Handroanthus impetiginosus TaxID=429701 RepID=A0A2G9GTQ3_9LAMI|nr:hypothetical protein CDL12_18813 [Handroanthus impetiginosus]
MKALFELMRLRKWDVDVLGEYFGVLENNGFLAEDKLQGNGVNYHVVSVFLEELKGVGFPVTKEVVDVILRPFFAVMMRSKDKILLGKVKSCLFDELVKMGKELLAKKKMGVDSDENDGDMLLGIVALRMGFSGRFYQVGSSADCIQGNRKVVLGLHEEFLKLEKDFESSGIEIAIPEYDNEAGAGDYDEVPQLIPIDYNAKNGNMEITTQEGAEDACNEDQPDNRIFKKNKKAKKGMDGDDKKRKKKKKKKEKKDDSGLSEINPPLEENGDLVTINGTKNLPSQSSSGNSASDDLGSDGTALALNETVILNLQKQFEKVADEKGLEGDEYSDFSDIPLTSTKHSKRKRRKTADGEEPNKNKTGDGEVEAAAMSVDKSAKKVRFAMKNNLVWKPQSPLPPESLRLPPSVTPRGSALKKGVPAGPIVEMPSVTKKMKKKKKKVQNRLKSATPVMKRRKKMQTGSA